MSVVFVGINHICFQERRWGQMIVKSTIRANCFDGPRWKVIVDLGPRLPELKIEPREARKIEKVIAHLKRNRRAYTMACYALALWLLPVMPAIDPTPLGGVAVAAVAKAGGMSGGKNIILLLQKASFWVGMGITIWGIVEAQLDFPGWKGRILKGILGYIGILLVPLIFLELQSSLQVDVWSQIDSNPGVLPTPGSR
jgi:hypothetical protein